MSKFCLILIASCFLFSIRLDGQVNADFSSSNTSACGSLQVSFFDQSTSSAGGIVDYKWDLAIANSSLQNPGAVYTSPGRYTICLTVTDVDGNKDTECKEDLVEIFADPQALFVLDVVEGCAPVNVIFDNQSTTDNGSIVSLLWDIGGTANVIDTNDPDALITSSYTSPGNYSASLTVVDEKGCQNTLSIPNIINVNGIPPVSLDVEFIESCRLPWAVQYTNLDADSDVVYIWDFGNGQTFEGNHPPQAFYNEAGTYDLTIFMSNGSCTDTAYFKDIVTTDPDISFTSSPDIICAGTEVFFADISNIPADSVLWIFGDGSISKDLSPSHSYHSQGCYDVQFIRYSRLCNDTTTLSCLDVLAAPDISYTLDNQFNCELPSLVSVTGQSSSTGDWSWVIDGHEPIDSQTAVFSLPSYGEYTLKLTFADEKGCIYTDDDIPLEVKPFEVNLPVRGPSGCTPLTFDLADSSLVTSNIVAWDWSIENGLYTSSLSNPSFTIVDTGTYDLQLIVTNDIGCMDTIVKYDYVQVGLLVNIDFVATPLVGCKEDIRMFTDLSDEFADEWIWIFDENESSSFEQNPEEEYDDAGIYDVTLIVTHNGCTNALTKSDYITVLEPDSEFSLVYSCDDPYTVEILNTTIGADSLIWNIFTSATDSIISLDSLLTPLTYADRGIYPISLYSKSFTTGCEDTFTDTIRIVDPIASYGVDTLRGCTPFTINIEDQSQDGFLYEYIPNTSTIDTTDVLFPTVTFTEGGLLTGPTLIITDIHECKDTFQLQDTVFVNKIEAKALYNQVVCIPSEEDYIDMSTDVLGNIIEWKWTLANSQFTDTSKNTKYFFDTEGTYDMELRVVDDWGCKDSLIVPQEILAILIEPDFLYDSVGCTFAAIQFKTEGNTQYIDSYLWEFGDGNTSTDKNPMYTYSDEGLYSVCFTMFDSRGCSKQICKDEIILIRDPHAVFSGDPLFSTCPPLLTQFENNSTNSHSYQWNFGDGSGVSYNETPSHVYTTPGNFDLELIAEWTPVCKDTAIYTDYVNVEGPLANFNVAYTPSCIPQNLTLTATSDELYDYVWDYGNGVLDSVAGLVTSDTSYYQYLVAGTYAPKLIITDVAGCTRSFSGEDIRVDEVILDFGIEDSIYCDPILPIQLDNLSQSTTDQVEYTWLLSGADILNSSDEAPAIDITNPGVYDVMLIAKYGGCIDTISKIDVFEVGSYPEISFDIDQAQFCAEVDINITNNTTIAYGTIEQWLWSLPDNKNSEEKSPVFSTSGGDSKTISLIAISNLGCADTLAHNYQVQPNLIADAGPDQLICIGEFATLSGQITPAGEGSFYWEDSPDLDCLDCLDPKVTTADTASYILTAVHTNGCISTDTVTVSVAPVNPPEIQLLSDSIICLGNTTVIEITDFNSEYSYIWDDTSAGLDCYKNCASINASPSQATTYTVTVTNIYGCETYDAIYIDVETDYIDFIDDQHTICENESITLSTYNGDMPTWEINNELSCSQCNETVATPSASTHYKVTVSSPLGCRYTDSIWIELVPDGYVQAGKDELICAGETISLAGVGTGEAQWTPSDLFSMPQSFNTEVTLTESQYLVLRMTDDLCVQEDSIYVKVVEKAHIEVTGDTICYGDEANISAGGRIDHLVWYDADLSAISSFKNIVKQPDTSTSYMAIGQFRTCIPDTALAYVMVHRPITYELTEYTYQIYLNDDIDIRPEYDDLRNYTFDWTPSVGLNCTDCPDPEIKGLTEHIDYTLDIVDEETGCAEEVEIFVRFIAECNGSVLYMPNIFSQNGNGANRTFGPITENKDEFISITILDRWGNQVFTTTDIDHRWDGTYHGSMVAVGVYIYTMTLICPETGETYNVISDVTVVR